MSTQAQYLRVAQVLAERISHGDYHLSQVPSGRKLAEEMQVSHIVARKAIEKLIADGRCRRQENGRITAVLDAAAPRRATSITMLHPAFDCSYFARCRQLLERAAVERGCLFRAVSYVHWNDPVIPEALNGFDGIFLLGNTEPLAQETLEMFRNSAGRLMTVDLDLTAAGIPRLALFDASCVRLLLRHLVELGHRHIDCINTQPCDVETARRINEWLQGCDHWHFQGELYNRPVSHYEDPVQRAYELTAGLVKRGDWPATAVFCTNEVIAYGVLRALRDAGIRPGALSVCAIGDGGNARYFCPSITCIEMPDITGLLDDALDWMSRSCRPWAGPLNLIPDNPPLFHGESTSPPPPAKCADGVGA